MLRSFRTAQPHIRPIVRSLTSYRSISQQYCSHHARLRSVRLLSSMSARPANTSTEQSPMSYLDGAPLPDSGNEIRALIDRLRPHLYIALSRANVRLSSKGDYMDVAEIDVACASVLDLVRMQKRSITSDELVRLTVKRIEHQVHEAQEAAAVIERMSNESQNPAENAQEAAQHLQAEYSDTHEHDQLDQHPHSSSSNHQSLSQSSDNKDRIKSPSRPNNLPKSTPKSKTSNPAFEVYSEQLMLERIALDDAVKGYINTTKQLVNMQKGAQLRPAQKMMAQWYGPLVAAIEVEREKAKAFKKSDKKLQPEMQYLPLLLSLEAPQLAVLTMHTMFSLALSHDSGFSGVRFSRAAHAVGAAVNMEVKMESLKKDRSKMRQFLASVITDDRSSSVLNKLRGAKVEQWSRELTLKLGAALLQILIKTAVALDSKQPVFRHDLMWDHFSAANPRLVGLIHTDERVLNTVLRDADVTEAMAPKLKPMVVKPRPWQGFDAGGYLSVQIRVMRSSGSAMQHHAVAHAELGTIYAGLNYLGAIPWRINTAVLKIVEELWTAGGGYGDLPTKTDLTVPDLPALPTGEVDRATMKAARREIANAIKSNRNLHSLRCDTELKLNVARQFRDRVIYFPFSVDFRGRAYPIPPHLNHLGNDLSRGLLTFHEAKPLGSEGLRWLRIHVTNLWGQGYDKLSFDDRVAWADEHMHLIRAAAKDPLNKAAMTSDAAAALPEVLQKAHMSSLWWLQAEKPFQFLAACFELDQAYSLDEPETYMCSLPVHQDGSCNGLQHYAALGRDVEGGRSVNLTPHEKPQDVYSVVCAEVNRRLAIDAANGAHEYAEALAGRIVRKIVKQTVMTSVYGVTVIGARDQIKARLLERTDIPWPEGADVENCCHHAALHLAQVTLDSLYASFSGARRIQNWLTEAAHLMSTIQQPVSWVTPLGLPIIQPYRVQSFAEVRTVVQQVTLPTQNDSLPVSAARQRSAFPPNFIHSLDASHMLLTALRCSEAGLTYTAVHDSYWTHAGTMSTMNGFLREEFVKLYEQPILQRLYDDWQSRFPEIEFPPVPETGDLDLRQVLESSYFFN